MVGELHQKNYKQSKGTVHFDGIMNVIVKLPDHYTPENHLEDILDANQTLCPTDNKSKLISTGQYSFYKTESGVFLPFERVICCERCGYIARRVVNEEQDKEKFTQMIEKIRFGF